MANQSKQQEIINTLSLLTDEQVDILSQFIKSLNIKNNISQKPTENDCKYLISDLLIKEWAKPEEDKAWQNL